MFRSRFLLTAMVAVAAALVAPATSDASFVLRVTSGALTEDIDLSTVSLTGQTDTTGDVQYTNAQRVVSGGMTLVTVTNMTIGDYVIQANFNQTNLPGAITGGNLSLSGLTVTRTGTTGSSNLTLALSATGFMLPSQQTDLVTDFTWQALTATAAPGRTVTMTSVFDTNNGLFTLVGPNTTNVGQPGVPASQAATGFAHKETNLGNESGPYSLTNMISIDNLGVGTLERLGQGTIDSSVVMAPAPAGLVLLAGALPFAGLLRRRLWKSEVATAA